MKKVKMKALIERYTKQYEEALVLATDIFNGSREDADMWMQTPTEILFGISPLECILAGDGEHVIGWLKERGAKV